MSRTTCLGTNIIKHLMLNLTRYKYYYQVREHSVLWATVDGKLKWQLHIFVCFMLDYLDSVDIDCRKLFLFVFCFKTVYWNK